MRNDYFKQIEEGVRRAAKFRFDEEETVREVMVVVERELRAFGGCDRCYGKGYATVEYKEGTEVKLCECERGRQLAKYFEEKR